MYDSSFGEISSVAASLKTEGICLEGYVLTFLTASVVNNMYLLHVNTVNTFRDIYKKISTYVSVMGPSSILHRDIMYVLPSH